MALILNIETATRVCSVALAKDGEIISFKETKQLNSHSELVTVFIEQVIKKSKLSVSDLDAVAVSKGPGSYTGLRIGVSTAKGLCYAVDKPLISVPTLQAMAFGMARNPVITNYDQYILFCPMIDARRMEVYTSLYDINNTEVKKVSAEIIDKDSFSEYLKKSKVIFFGDGSEKCKDTLSYQKNAVFISDIHPSGSYMATLAEKKFNNNDFEDLAYFEPFYLKDFIAGIPKVKGLR